MVASSIRFALELTVLGSVFALILSVWPGVLSHVASLVLLLLLLSWPVTLPVVAVVWILWTRAVIHDRPRPFPTRQALATPIVAATALALLTADVPRRTAFAYSRPAFEKTLSMAKQSGRQETNCVRWLGVYKVDKCVSDHRGGVYFRVFSHIEGFSADTVSYGLAFRPNAEGPPFGAARYRTSRLSGDWFVFRVSNDSC